MPDLSVSTSVASSAAVHPHLGVKVGTAWMEKKEGAGEGREGALERSLQRRHS